MSTQVEYDPEQEGIVAFEVAVSPSRDFQSTRTTIRYEFGGPVGPEDLVEPHADAAELAAELAEAQLDQLVAEKEAKGQQEKERQAKSSGKKKPAKKQAAKKTAGRKSKPKTQDDDGDQLDWKQASKPNNKGTFRYRSTDDLDSDALKVMVSQAIEDAGADPELHVVYDERIGKNGLEAGKSRWSFATVKPTEDNPAYDWMLGEASNGNEFVKASFYVDFNEDGTVRVKPSNAYKEAASEAQAAEEDDEEGSDEMPF